MVSRRSRTLRLKSSSVHWYSCVPPPESPAAAERRSLLSLSMWPFLLRVPASFPLGKEGTPWEAKVVLSSWWHYTCWAIHRSVPKTRFSDVGLPLYGVLRSSRRGMTYSIMCWGVGAPGKEYKED